MARIRTVKPELFRHEDLFEAEIESGLPLRLAYIGLFTVADREGRFKWKPRQIKLDVMPYDDGDFSRVLDALVTRGFVVKYEHLKEWYGVIPTFTDHQVINNRESQSKLPCPNLPNIHASPTRHDLAQVEWKGREQGREKEEEGKPPHRSSNFLDMKDWLILNKRNEKGKHRFFKFDGKEVGISDRGIPYWRDSTHNLTKTEADTFYKAMLNDEDAIAEAMQTKQHSTHADKEKR